MDGSTPRDHHHTIPYDDIFYFKLTRRDSSALQYLPRAIFSLLNDLSAYFWHPELRSFSNENEARTNARTEAFRILGTKLTLMRQEFVHAKRYACVCD